jgi:hypothetical protein
MIDSRKLLTIGVPCIAASVVLSMLFFHPAVTDAPAPVRAPGMKAEPPVVAAAPRGPVVLRPAPPPPPPPKPAPEQLLAQATDDARVISTYQNFRSAVATGNQPLQDALWPAVRRNRDVAVRLAEKEMSTAASSVDRDIAQKTLEALRR